MSPALFTNQDAAIVELTDKLAKVTAERDRARDIAVALEQEVAGIAEVWDEGFEAAFEWVANNPGPSGIPHDPPMNPYYAPRGGAA